MSAKAIVKPVPTCRHCGTPGVRFLQRCPRCGRRHLIPSANVPGAKH